MTTLKPWEQSRTIYSSAGNSTILRDNPINQTTTTSETKPEEETKPEKTKPEEIKKTKNK